MRILVTAASQHGATAEIADAIAERLRASGTDVVRQLPEDVVTLDGVDAVVCGSAVYMSQWMPAARAFLKRFESQLSRLPVWAFSVGLSGVPKYTVQDPTRIGPVLTQVHVIHHRVFPGRYDPELLSLRERSVARLAGAVEGDFRDWASVDDWAQGIAADLARRLPSA